MSSDDQLDSLKIERLNQFIGYGPRNPGIVFVGIEEKVHKDDDWAANIAARCTHNWKDVMDLSEGHKILSDVQKSRYNPLDKSERAVPQWTTAAGFAIRLSDKDQKDPTPKDVEKYRVQYLGRSDGKTLLSECYPVPRHGSNHRISGYIPEIGNPWWDTRVQAFRDFFKRRSLRFVVSYGNPAHRFVGEVFGPQHWEHVEYTDNKSKDPPQCAGLVCRVKSGIVVCRTGFWGQGGFRNAYIPDLAARMRKLAKEQ